MAVVNKGYAEGTIDAKEYDTKARELLIERDKLTKEITKTAIEEDKKAAEEKKKLQERESKATYDLTEAKIQAQKDEIDGDEFAVKERQKIAQEEYDAKLKRLEDEKAATLENTDLTETEKAAKLAEYNNQEIEAHQKMEDAKLDATKSALDQAASSYQQYAGAIQSITDGIFDNEAKGQKKNLAERNKILKKKFIADKAMGIVNAGISTAQSVMQALASTPPPAGYVMAALNGAMGIAQIAAIAAKQFNPETGSGSGAGASSIGGLQSAASMNQPQLQGSSLFNIGKTQMNINTPPPQKVYVTEGDISSTQNKVSVIQGRSLIH